jgi:hypothetical protein
LPRISNCLWPWPYEMWPMAAYKQGGRKMQHIRKRERQYRAKRMGRWVVGEWEELWRMGIFRTGKSLGQCDWKWRGGEGGGTTESKMGEKLKEAEASALHGLGHKKDQQAAGRRVHSHHTKTLHSSHLVIQHWKAISRSWRNLHFLKVWALMFFLHF